MNNFLNTLLHLTKSNDRYIKGNSLQLLRRLQAIGEDIGKL